MNKDDEILLLIKNLNTRIALPVGGLRRNSIYYNLITYINHTVALYLSGSFDDVALFIKRADKELGVLTSGISKLLYVDLCSEYLDKMSNYLLGMDKLTIEGINVLPSKYKGEK